VVTRDYAGSGGSSGNCTNVVATILGYNNYPTYSQSCATGSGCTLALYWYDAEGNNSPDEAENFVGRCTSPTTDAGSPGQSGMSGTGFYPLRVCACNS